MQSQITLLFRKAGIIAKTECKPVVSSASSQAGKIIENAEKTLVSQREKTLRGLESQITVFTGDTAASFESRQAVLTMRNCMTNLLI